MSTLEIRAPEEQTEGTRSQVLRWLKGVGDAVTQHEPLIEIETDKVTVEVAAPASGVLREILKTEQEEIAPGEVLGRLELAGAERAEQRDAAGAQRAEAAGAASGGGTPRGRAAADASGTRAADTATDRRDGEAGRSRAGTSPLSPAVRRLIAERGLDPATIRGTGEGGRITVDDVLAHDGRSTQTSTAVRAPNTHAAPGPKAARAHDGDAAPGPKAQSSAARLGQTQQPDSQPAHLARPATAPSSDSSPPSHTVPHSPIRKRIADHMVQSLLHTAPHVTTVFEADMSRVLAHRTTHKSDFETRGAPLTLTAYFVAAAVKAIQSVPEANSRWTDSALEIYDTINIGIATALEDGGLVVPVLRVVEARTLFDIAQGLNELVTAARTGKLQPTDVRGGTFTISNHGVSGSLIATPIVINQPQSAILGVGRLEKRATVIERQGRDEIAIQPRCYVTLTIDHRVMDGHQANGFLTTFVKTLETWPAQ
jgi:2-oxoglutarate dehydrogenase E2 component (dihydrolipoamide succinyltransferase)